MNHVQIEYHGSIILVRPLTGLATTWLEDHVADPTWWGDALVVEPGYLDALLEGMFTDLAEEAA